MAPAIPWPINTTYTQSSPMPDVTSPSRSNPLPSRLCSVIGVWPQLAACSSSSSPDSGSPSPVPACSAVRVQGSRRPLGSGLHRSGLRAPVGTGQCPIAQARGCAPATRTANAGCQWPSPSPPRGLRGCAPATVPTATDHRRLSECEDRQLQCVNSYYDFFTCSSFSV
jgi:hypothetical protein